MSSNLAHTGVVADINPEQLASLYRKTGLGFWGTLFLASCFGFFVITNHSLGKGNGTANYLFLAIWFILVIGLCLYRSFVSRQFNAESYRDPEKTALWANKYVLLTTCVNVLWGIAAAFEMVRQDNPTFATLPLILFCALLLSIPLLSISRLSYGVQFVAILVPLVVSFIPHIGAGDDTYEAKLGLASTCVFAITLYLVSEYIYRLLHDLQESRASLSKQANTDNLTQIANRRYFDQVFKTEWRRTTRDDLPISLLLIDIDNFQKYNDLQGTRAGDSCLKSIACLDTVTRRPGDIAARYGGEEFAVLLPNTGMENAIMLAENLRKRIEQLQLPHAGSDHKVVTVSIGVSCCAPQSTLQTEDGAPEVMYPAMLMNAADNAMFLAKKQGRNRIAEQKCGEQRLAQVLQRYAATEPSRS